MTIPSQFPTSRWQMLFRILLGAAMVLAGIGHLFFLRVDFQAQVPNWIPFSKDAVVLASGVVEIAMGLAMVFLGHTELGWA